MTRSLGARRLADPAESDSPLVPGQWFQLLTTGTFHSPTYGVIDITPQDLATMYRNFKKITPLPPTQLPIDFDHLSDNPEKPGDGQAAGWIQDLELRSGGKALWCRADWTPDAAAMIRAHKYRYISPYFLTAYEDKRTGQNVGPTLKAAGLTNRPFLEGMAGSGEGHLAVAASDTAGRRIYLSTVPSPRRAPMPKQIPAVAAADAPPPPHHKPGAEGGAPPAHGLTCPHCGAPVSHDGSHLGAAPDPEDAGDGGADEGAEMGDSTPQSPHDHAEGTDAEGVERKEPDEEPTNDPGPDAAEESVELDGLPAPPVPMAHPPAPPFKPGVKPEATHAMSETSNEKSLRERLERTEAALAETQKVLANDQRTKRRQAAERLLDGAIRAGKVTPALAGTVAKPGWARSFAFRDPNGFATWLKGAPVLIKFGENGTSREDAANSAEETQTKIDKLAQVYMAEHKGTVYADAVKAVLTEHRSLAERYDEQMIGTRSTAPTKMSASVRRL